MASASSPSIITGRNPIKYSTSDPLTLFIIQIFIIVCVCRLLHLGLRRIYQPSVISEIIGGIILGPSVLGQIDGFTDTIFPKESLVGLNLVANFGLVLFLFMVGLELDPRVLKNNFRKSIVISITGMLLPFGLGIATSYSIYKYLMDSKGKFVNFMLFCGVAMAITAFPVLARILTERNLLKTTVGSIAISSAAIDDVTSWCLLALVIALTNNSTGLSALWVFLVGLGWTLFVLLILRPIYCKYLRWSGCLSGREPSQFVLFVTFMIVIISAFFTDVIGIHAIFGGFIIGVIIPHDGGFAIKVTEKIEDIVHIFFLPIYFALSGLKTNFSDLNDGITWGLLILVCATAFIGKIGGCTLAARFSKFTWRESFTIGFLMNCKGLVELIALNIGLQAGVINTRIFTMMVVMALVTTFVTSPMVIWLYPLKYQHRLEAKQDLSNDNSSGDNANENNKGPSSGGTSMNLLVVLSRVQQVPALMTLLGYIHHNRLERSDSQSQPKQYLHESIDSQDTGKGGSNAVATREKPIAPINSVCRSIHVFALRLLELAGDRTSSIMQLYETESLAITDPVISMLRAFARVANLVFHGSLSYTEVEHFVDTVVGSSSDANAELTIVSAFGRGSRTTATNNIATTSALYRTQNNTEPVNLGEVSPGWFSSMGWGFTTAQQTEFITTLFSKANNHVGVFIDCGISDGKKAIHSTAIDSKASAGNAVTDQSGPSSSVVKMAGLNTKVQTIIRNRLYFADGNRVPLIIVPFFGGADDRLALKLACDVCTHSNVQVLVWRFIKTDDPTEYDVFLREDVYPSMPMIPETPAAVAKPGNGEVNPWDQILQTHASLEPQETRIDERIPPVKLSDSDSSGYCEAEEFEKQKDSTLIDDCLKPRPIGADRPNLKTNFPSGTENGAVSHILQAAGTAASNSAGKEQNADKLGISTDGVLSDNNNTNNATSMEFGSNSDDKLKEPALNSTQIGSGGGLRQRIAQHLRIRRGTNDNELRRMPSSATTNTEEYSTTVPGLKDTMYSNVSIETIITATPLQALLLKARALDSPDLIICGRSVKSSLTYFSHDNEVKMYTPAGHLHTKPDRQFALGTITEYLLGFGTSASILTLQAHNDIAEMKGADKSA